LIDNPQPVALTSNKALTGLTKQQQQQKDWDHIKKKSLRNFCGTIYGEKPQSKKLNRPRGSDNLATITFMIL
jgi:hypothetical protein